MTRAWRKVYRDANHDPKLTTLSPLTRLVWVGLLLELEDDGSLPALPGVPLAVHVGKLLDLPPRACAKSLDALVSRGLLVVEGDALFVPSFEDRQARAGSTAEAVDSQPVVRPEDSESAAEKKRRIAREKKARWRARQGGQVDTPSTVSTHDVHPDGGQAVDKQGGHVPSAVPPVSTPRARAEAESEAEVEKKQRREGERAGATPSPSLPPVTIPLRGEQPEPVAEAQATLETLHRESQGRVPAQADTESLRALGRFLVKQKQVRGYAPPAFVALGWYLRLQGGDDGFTDPVMTPARLCARDCALLLSLLQEATAWVQGGCKRQRRKSGPPHRAEEVARALSERLSAMAPMRGAA